MLAAGLAAIVIGIAMGYFIPINKNLWTPSYAVFTAGIALCFITACYWLIDIRRFTAWQKPFLVFGMNSIAAYFLSSLAGRIMVSVKLAADGGKVLTIKEFIYHSLTGSIGAGEFASLVYSLIFMLVWLGIMYPLYRKEIFIKI
jgi:predicted acyltransferase